MPSYYYRSATFYSLTTYNPPCRSDSFAAVGLRLLQEASVVSGRAQEASGFRLQAGGASGGGFRLQEAASRFSGLYVEGPAIVVYYE